MPRGDRTGPTGMGPMTGRGMGYCAGNDRPGFMEPGPGRGQGRGFGRGFGPGFGRGRGKGFKRFAYAPQPPQAPGNYNQNYRSPANQEEELDYLKNVAENLQRELKAVNDRIDELKNNEDK